MTAKIYQLRDYRRREEKLEKMAAEILAEVDTSPCEMIPYHGSGIDGMFAAPENDPA